MSYGTRLWVMHLAIGCCFCAVLYPCSNACCALGIRLGGVRSITCV